MSNYKEIVTKAVVGKGKKTTNSSYRIVPEQTPDTVLGCWVINHNFHGVNNGSNVNINGSFDVNVWYSYDNDTKTAVSTKKFGYEDRMNITLKENAAMNSNPEIIVRSLKQPTVTDVSIESGEVKMNIEKELGVELVGDAKVRIEILDSEDDYEVIVDDPEITDTDLAEIDESVDENYMS